MPDFFKRLNGQYATWYRRSRGGRGYVFQDRYKSYLIQNDSYLQAVIGYLLTNPVRAGRVENFLDYPWSSATCYFRPGSCDWMDAHFVEELYSSFAAFCQQVNQGIDRELPVVKTRVGEIIGDERFTDKALRKFDRRRSQARVGERKRIDEYHFDPVDKVLQEFRNMYHVDADALDTTTHEGKRLRGNLLVLLKDKAGLTYSEIITLPIFSDVKLQSLGKLYRDARNRMNRMKKRR